MAKLTRKQRMLVKGIAAGKTQKQAAKEAGLDRTYASKVLKQPQLTATLAELLERSGLGDMSLLAKLKELLEARKVIAVVTGKDAGMGSVDFIVPNYTVQARALDFAFRLRGAYQKKVEQKGVTPVPVDFRGTFVGSKGRELPEAGQGMLGKYLGGVSEVDDTR